MQKDAPYAIETQFVSSSRKKYVVRTTHKVQVKDIKYANQTSVDIKQYLLQKNDTGFVFCIEMHNIKQEAQDVLSLIMQDIAPVSSKVVFQTDRHGNMLSIINKQELIQKWIDLKPALCKKYKSTIEAINFFNAYEQELAKEEDLITSMKHKGVYGVLLAGIYGYDYTNPFERKIALNNFFNEIDLPIHVTLKSKMDNYRFIQLTGIGYIDEDAFEEDNFNRLIKKVVDDLAFKASKKFIYSESYIINQQDGWLTEAEQYLKMEVPGVYYNEIYHKLEIKL
jgi:hypothetical protein